jgi:hypothetical protein
LIIDQSSVAPSGICCHGDSQFVWLLAGGLGEMSLELASQILEGSNCATTVSWAADPG